MFWITKKRVNSWFDDKKIFFILAIGRSGTFFFYHLLNKAKYTHVVHEPVKSDNRSYEEAFFNEKKAFRYFKNFRKKEIFLRCKNEDFKTYGEVNSVLRRHCNAIKEVFPNAVIFHLVRDGRDVVRSMMARKTMLRGDRNTKRIKPPKSNPWYDKWDTMNRFERLCWYWDVENRYMIENIDRIIYFEKLLSDYDYFNKNLLEPLNLEITKETWENEISAPKNITKKHAIPRWNEWCPEKLKSFYEICGETMQVLGYKV